MCGICGMVGEGTRDTVETVTALNDAMQRRGPDDAGIYVSPGRHCIMGNRRLRVIDLTSAGHMPMSDESGRFWITYNGEVYNFRELREVLIARGHTLRSRTDTEVVLRMFLEFGEASVARLNGMFAFAIWDEQERALFLARDRSGIKPLYYTHSDDGFWWSSDLRALLKAGVAPARADPEAIGSYLMLGSVADDRTIIRGVHALPPGHHAVLCDGRLAVRQYRDYLDMSEPRSRCPGGAADSVRDALTDAVRRQMVSDVPLGLFLSGGVDSSLLAAVARKEGHEAIRSVSIRFADEGYDEGPEARAIAETLGLDHTEVTLTATDVAGELDAVVAAMDQPSVDAINTYFVSRAARCAGLTVALSGLGADELFGGYTSFTRANRVRTVARLAGRVPASGTALRAGGGLPGLPRRVRRAAAWVADTRDASWAGAYLAVRGLWSPQDVRRFAPDFAGFDPLAYAAGLAGDGFVSQADAMSFFESRLYMHNQLLRDTDAMSMHHSLEIRVPFLDDAVNRAAGETRELAASGGKPVLRTVRASYFAPDFPVWPKRGFSFPFEPWLQSGRLGDLRNDRPAVRLLSDRAWQEVWGQFRAGHRDWAQVWAPLVLEWWLGSHGVSVA